MQQTVIFPSGTADYYFHSRFSELRTLAAGRDTVLITDEHVAACYPGYFSEYNTIVLPAGEESKSLATIHYVCEVLLARGITRKGLIVGVGGGVITDIAGFAASVYMRGIAYAAIPTTLLGMVDAAIGGKNGVNVGVHKNMAGTIRQPEFILFDTAFLEMLPAAEWNNGFAEIIKYACIFDADLFSELSRHNTTFYQQNNPQLDELIARCVAWKNKTVIEDETEKGLRKLLNFGHTAGHAFENLCHIPHGCAVGIGMLVACVLSAEVFGIDKDIYQKLRLLLLRYGLPVQLSFDAERVMDVLMADKKRKGDIIEYILLEDVGRAVIEPLSPEVIKQGLVSYACSYTAG